MNIQIFMNLVLSFEILYDKEVVFDGLLIISNHSEQISYIVASD